MANYFVRKTGSDGNAGTSKGAAKLTIQAAINIATSPGDNVYVGAGVYRETVTFGTSGTAGNPISLIGDYKGTYTDDAGVVRITGSADDIARTRVNCITANTKSYITISGFQFDLASGHLIDLAGASANWTISKCDFKSDGNAKFGISMASACTNVGISQCRFTGAGGISGNGTAADNSGHTISNCIFQMVFASGGYSCAVTMVGVGGCVVRNCVVMGTVAQAFNATSLNSGQSLTVTSCICVGCWYVFYAGAVGMIIENYNTLWDNSTARYNTTAGANSVTRPPLFDTRWFFEMVNGGRLVTPFDLASYSTLVEYNGGTGAPATDLRGASVVGTYREWGPLEYDSSLSIAGGGASRVIGSPFIRGLGAV